jgi:hypothetical protein
VTTQHRFRNNKYRLEIRERDHGPPHCHLVGGEVDILIELGTLRCHGTWPRGLKAEVLAWVQDHLQDLWKEWQRWHP